MAIMLTRQPLKTLLLCPPSFAATVPAAVLLAAALHPAMLWLSEGIQQLYPISPALAEKLKPFDAAGAWSSRCGRCCCLVALTPAICEELAFRGFILSGLRRMGHKWGAIVLTGRASSAWPTASCSNRSPPASSASSSATSP